MAVRLPVGLALLCMGIVRLRAGPVRDGQEIHGAPGRGPGLPGLDRSTSPRGRRSGPRPMLLPSRRRSGPRSGRSSRPTSQAQSLANPMIDYLLWRQSLNPVRFTANHPNLSPALSQLLTSSPQLPANVPPPTFTPVPQVQPVTTSPQVVSPPLIHPFAAGNLPGGHPRAQLDPPGPRDDRRRPLVAETPGPILLTPG